MHFSAKRDMLVNEEIKYQISKINQKIKELNALYHIYEHTMKQLKMIKELNALYHIYEHTMKQLKMYENIEVSERQIKEGKVKDARESLLSIRKRYGI